MFQIFIISFTGQAIMGAGVSPLLYQANVTPIVFTKKRAISGNISNQ
jgi:hypothetical protein